VKADARARLAPALAEVFCRAEQPFFQPIFDLTAPRMVFGRALVLGDAAFVARPHVGAGVTKAALDAVCLADSLAADVDIGRALARYDAERRGFGDWIVARSRDLGACIGLDGLPARSSLAERMSRTEFVVREYMALPGEVKEWAGRALHGAPA
jgi:2-polyprenyl-6-methoxyphenol hydroxylase-like FAD-dependent oxidoreductase